MENILTHNRDAGITQGTFLISGGLGGSDGANSGIFGNFMVLLHEV